MFTSTSMFTLVGALVGASAYAAERPVAAAAAPTSLQAVADINGARVDLYCDHRSQAVAGIRAARQKLLASAARVPMATLDALDQAAWLARHDQYAGAEQALETALARMAQGHAA